MQNQAFEDSTPKYSAEKCEIEYRRIWGPPDGTRDDETGNNERHDGEHKRVIHEGRKLIVHSQEIIKIFNDCVADFPDDYHELFLENLDDATEEFYPNYPESIRLEILMLSLAAGIRFEYSGVSVEGVILNINSTKLYRILEEFHTPPFPLDELIEHSIERLYAEAK